MSPNTPERSQSKYDNGLQHDSYRAEARCRCTHLLYRQLFADA